MNEDLMREHLMSRLTRQINLDATEQAAIEDLLTESQHVPAGQTIFEAGQFYDHAVLFLDGWAQLYRVLNDGRKQTFDFLLPADVAGMENVLGRESIQTIETMTDCRVIPVDKTKILELAREHPRLPVGLLWIELRQVSILQEHLMSVGRRSALESLTHLFLELQTRLREVGRANDHYELPITQSHLADLLGLSDVHVSRTLQTLRKRNVIDIKNRRVIIVDQDHAEDLAEFTPEFLQ